MDQEKQLSLYELLPQVMEEAGYIQKQGKVEMGGGRGYKFASLEQVLEKVNHALASRGIFCHSSTNTLERFEITTPNGSDGKPKATQIHAVSRVSLTYGKLTNGVLELAGPFEGTGSGADTGDKSVMKANSSAMKYALQKAFHISWGDDPETENDTSLYEEKETKAKGKPAAKPQKQEKAAPAASATPPEDTKSAGAMALEGLLTRIRSTKTQNEHELLKAEFSRLRIKDKDGYRVAAALWESEGNARGFIPAQQ